jgi:hypothetical protein
MSLPLDTKPAIMYPRDETPRQEKTLRILKPFIAQQIQKMSESLINELKSVGGKIREDFLHADSVREITRIFIFTSFARINIRKKCCA